MNGLPYITWEQFRSIRKVLASQHKQSSATAAMVQSKDEILVLNEEDVHAEVAVTPQEGQLACAGCKVKGPIARKDLMEMIGNEQLKESCTRRSKQVGSAGQKVPMWIFGSYSHGPMTGLTRATFAHQQLTRALTAFVRQETSIDFTAVSLMRNCAFRPHRDRNMPKTLSAIFGLTEFQGGQLRTKPWISNKDQASGCECGASGRTHGQDFWLRHSFRCDEVPWH